MLKPKRAMRCTECGFATKEYSQEMLQHGTGDFRLCIKCEAAQSNQPILRPIPQPAPPTPPSLHDLIHSVRPEDVRRFRNDGKSMLLQFGPSLLVRVKGGQTLNFEVKRDPKPVGGFHSSTAAAELNEWEIPMYCPPQAILHKSSWYVAQTPLGIEDSTEALQLLQMQSELLEEEEHRRNLEQSRLKSTGLPRHMHSQIATTTGMNGHQQDQIVGQWKQQSYFSRGAGGEDTATGHYAGKASRTQYAGESITGPGHRTSPHRTGGAFGTRVSPARRWVRDTIAQPNHSSFNAPQQQYFAGSGTQQRLRPGMTPSPTFGQSKMQQRTHHLPPMQEARFHNNGTGLNHGMGSHTFPQHQTPSPLHHHPQQQHSRHRNSPQRHCSPDRVFKTAPLVAGTSVAARTLQWVPLGETYNCSFLEKDLAVPCSDSDLANPNQARKTFVAVLRTVSRSPNVKLPYACHYDEVATQADVTALQEQMEDIYGANNVPPSMNAIPEKWRRHDWH